MSVDHTFLWLPSCHILMMSQVQYIMLIVTFYQLSVDFAWLTDSNIVSCSKDGKFIYEGIQKTVKPADKAVSMSVCLCLLFVCVCVFVY